MSGASPHCGGGSRAWHMGAVPPGGGPGRARGGTCAGVPILGQLVALPAVALVGAVDVGSLLAAALGLTLVHVCAQTGRRSRSRAGTEVSLTWSLLLRDHRVQPPPGADGEPEVQKKARGQPGTCGEAGVGVVECWPAAWRGTTVARRPPWGTRCCSTAGHGSLGRRF